MLCRHYMVRSAVAVSTVLDTATLGEALARMVKNHLQQLLVVNAAGEYKGELTTFILARMLLPPEAAEPQTQEQAEDESAIDVDDRIMPHLNRKVIEFAANDIPVMTPDSPLAEALKALAGGTLRLPVVDPRNNKLVGVISSLTILRRYQF